MLACRAASGRPALYILDGDGRPAPAALHEHPYAPDTFRPNVLERDSAGRWIIVGALTDLDSDRHGVPALVRFLPDGTPDPSYGARGLAQLPGTHRTWQLALRASARISCQDRMLVGLETNRRPGFAVFRDDGTLATEVGSGGLILVNQAAPEDPFPRTYGLLLARPTAEVALLPWYNPLTFNAVRVVQ